MSKPVTKVAALDSETRVCRICNVEKQLNTEFSFHSGYECYSRMCKSCLNIRKQLIYSGQPLPDIYKPRELKKKRVIENKPYRKTSFANRKRLNYKSYDKKRGFDCDLTVEFIEKCLASSCHYCGFPSTGLDRKDCAIGHTIENCVPACYECNTGKMDFFSYEEMLEIGKSIKKVKFSRLPNTMVESIKTLIPF